MGGLTEQLFWYQVWSPSRQGLIDVIEGVQRRAKKIKIILQGLSLPIEIRDTEIAKFMLQ